MWPEVECLEYKISSIIFENFKVPSPPGCSPHLKKPCSEVKMSYRKFYYILEKLERLRLVDIVFGERGEGEDEVCPCKVQRGRFREGYENTGLAKIQTKFEVGKFKFFKKT